MSGPHRPPPPIINRQKVAEDGTSGAKVQMKMLCKFLLKELLDQTDEDIEATFVTYGDNLRDLYDVIIEAINNEPGIMQHKHGVTRINNIFDDYAGIAPDQRAYKPPPILKYLNMWGIQPMTVGSHHYQVLHRVLKHPRRGAQLELCPSRRQIPILTQWDIPHRPPLGNVRRALHGP